MAKNEKEATTSDKLHVEIVRANWERLKSYLETYNANPTRMTPKLKPADAINAALAEFLKGEGKKNGKARK